MFFDLPGPRRFAHGLRHKIELGATTTVLLPRSAAPRGLKPAVFPRASPGEVRALRLSSMDPAGEGTIAARLADAVDMQRPVGARVDVTSLATARDLGRRVVWVEADTRTCADLIEDWLDLTGQFAEAAKNVPVADRPTLVTVLTGHDLPASADLDDVDVVWWWGVLERLDTAVHVAERTFGNTAVSPDIAAMIVEVAGHDLNLADTLAEIWRGDPDQACELLADHATRMGWDEKTAPATAGRKQPPADGLAGWHSGALENWKPDGTRFHVACDPDMERAVRGRIWRAQIQTVFPRIEQLRQVLVPWIATNHAHLNDYWKETNPAGLEIGAMTDLIESSSVLTSDSVRRNAAKWAARTRNELAHLTPLSSRDLMDGARLFTAVEELR